MSSSYWPSQWNSGTIHFIIPTKVWVTLTSHICFKFTIVTSSNLNMTEKHNIPKNLFSFYPKILMMCPFYRSSLGLSENNDLKNISRSWFILTSRIPFQFTIVTSTWQKNTILLIPFSVSIQLSWWCVNSIFKAWGFLRISTSTLPQDHGSSLLHIFLSSLP